MVMAKLAARGPQIAPDQDEFGLALVPLPTLMRAEKNGDGGGN